MASAQMHVRPEEIASRERRTHAALRLMCAERSEEIFPSLLDEIIGLGFPRALIAEVDFDSFGAASSRVRQLFKGLPATLFGFALCS